MNTNTAAAPARLFRTLFDVIVDGRTMGRYRRRSDALEVSANYRKNVPSASVEVAARRFTHEEIVLGHGASYGCHGSA